jgi:hypothetical protein
LPDPHRISVPDGVANHEFSDKTKGVHFILAMEPAGEPAMPESRTAAAVFDQEFLPIRAKLLEVAAALDRIGRADGTVTDDPRWGKIRDAISMLMQPENDRAEQIQLNFSRPYDDDWQKKFNLQRIE